MLISGSIPEPIGGLSWLERLSLDEPEVVGSIPDSVGQLSDLKELSIQSQCLSSSIPNSIGQLLKLEKLHLRSSCLTGTIPKEIGLCSKLQSISIFSQDIIGANVSGQIPLEACGLSELRSLSLASTLLYGVGECKGAWPNLEKLELMNMPNELADFHSLIEGRTKLNYLDISVSPITGTPQFETLPSLEIFKASYCLLTGELDPVLWTLPNLTTVDLKESRMYGSIPSTIGQAKKLDSLDCSFRKLVGSIPPELGLCTSLRGLTLSNSELTGTIPPELSKLSQLEAMYFSGSQISGSLPDSFSELSSLTYIGMAACQLSSTIPPSWSQMKSLQILDLSFNQLSGTIPDFSSQVTGINLVGNLLVGSIPPQLLATANSIKLAQNHLSGTIPETLASNPSVFVIDLSSNELTGTLPTFSQQMEQDMENLQMSLSNNHFTGTIPDQYGRINFDWLKLANNRLNGSISLLTSPSQMKLLDVSNNFLEGTIPTPEVALLETLSMSNNRFQGEIPDLPPSLVSFSAAHNRLSGDITHLLSPLKHPNLKTLDLSHNLFSGPLPDLSFTQINNLYLDHNAYQGPVYGFLAPRSLDSYIKELDLSNNSLTGVFPANSILLGQISTLKLSGNQFHGHLILELMPDLSVLDISNNFFDFDAAEFDSTSLTSLNARNNLIYGTLSLHGMTNLRTADFRNNSLDFPLDLHSLGLLFSKYELEILLISQNPSLPTITDLGNNSAILERSKSTTPSVHIGVKCFQLVFTGSVETVFNYDEPLFDYDQCECDETHFGSPPAKCFVCPSSGRSPGNCSGPLLSIDPNNFVYDASSPGNSTEIPIGVESCFAPHYQIGTSNCLGISIKWDKTGPAVSSYQTGLPFPGNVDSAEPSSQPSFVPSQSQFQNQCRLGSSGRRCWKCDCQPSGKCYYPGPGNLCLPCSTVFKASTYVPVALTLVFVAILALTIVFYCVLKSKRTVKDTMWQSLPFWKRISYRLIHLTGVSHITVMVTFVQLLVELTNWDAYAIRTWLKLVNGESDGLGLRCFFPFLSNPMSLLLLKLFLPFIGSALVCISIGLAEVLYRILMALPVSKSSSDSSGTPQSQDDTIALLPSGSADMEIRVDYPAAALVSSTSISIFRFFYFGAALSSLDYLFSETQNVTNKKFVQSVPWMEFDDAKVLRGVSIPFMVLFLLLVPALFVLLAWKLRHKISSPFVRLYFGSLFDNFQSHVYWWEIVMILKKIAIALVLRSLAPNNGFQTPLLVCIIGSLLIATSTWKPWKQWLVNVLYSVSALLLILSLVISRLSDSSQSFAVFTSILVLDGIFIALCTALIAKETITGQTDYEKQWSMRFSESAAQTTPNGPYGPPLLRKPMAINHENISEIED
jgi:Leucine-rich repeat (LRR) protein